jgi:hypothetical protein
MPNDDIKTFEADLASLIATADALTYRDIGYHIAMGATRQPGDAGASWATVLREIERLSSQTAGLPVDSHIAQYLRGILHALYVFSRVRDGEAISYLDQARAYLELDDIWIADDELDPYRHKVLECLSELGLPDDLHRGLAEWEALREVPDDDVVAVAESMIPATRTASLQRGIPIAPEAEVTFSFTSTPYYAYARYHGNQRGMIEFSSDIRWTYEAIQHSVCHEAFPGHQASASARELSIERGEWSPLTVPGLANTPISPIVEGLAENGTEILGWVNSSDERLYAACNSLTFGVCTNAVVLRHQEGYSREATIDYVIQHAGVQRDWAKYQFGFLTNPLWHTSFPHYWHGAKLIRQARAQFDGREHRLYEALYTRPFTTSTLRSWLLADITDRDPGCP